MKNILLAISFFSISISAMAQTEKQIVFGEFGLGFGQTIFNADISARLIKAYGGNFSPGIGNNLMMGFYLAPETWKGFGLGSRIKGTFGTPVKGDFGDDYIFNYYNLALTAKYYPVSREFNKGFYTRASVGFGQMTTKRVNESANIFKHQYAIGSTLMAGLGYTFPLGKSTALSIESEFEYSSRGGTIDGVGEATFISSQIGANIILSF
ncbi:MAG: hypothetical protein ACFCUU_18645 [Cyclobacteriaceae bacterium]